MILQTEAAECGLACLGPWCAGFMGMRWIWPSCANAFGMGLRGMPKTVLGIAAQLDLAARPSSWIWNTCLNSNCPPMPALGHEPFCGAQQVSGKRVVIHDPPLACAGSPWTSSRSTLPAWRWELQWHGAVQPVDETRPACACAR